MESLESWTVLQLKTWCESKGIQFNSQDRKAQIIEKIMQHEETPVGVGKCLEGAEKSDTKSDSQSETYRFQSPNILSFDEQKALMEYQFNLKLKERQLALDLKQREQQFALDIKREEFKMQKELEELKQGPSSNPIRVLKIRDMREDEDVEEYFQLFEKAATAMHLPKEAWIGNLSYHLNDKSRSVFLEMAEIEMNNYETIRNKILQAHQLTAEHYRCKFRQSSKKSNEDFILWARRTRRYLNSWMEVAQAKDSREILEQITIEKLLDSVSEELQIWLREKNIKTADEFGRLANEFVQARKGPIIDGRYIGYKTKEFKYAKEIRNPLVRVSNGSRPNISHIPNKQKEINSENVKRPMSDIKCYNCQDFGHYANRCSKPDRRKLGVKGAATGLLCFKPLVGNKLNDYSIIGQIEGKDARMLVDSGCTRTLVHRRFVPKNAETGDFISVLLANGETLETPLAEVKIRGKDQEFAEIVGVVDELPTDCLLGRSSYGRSLTQKEVLRQWENFANLDSNEEVKDFGFVVTRSQAIHNAAQERLDKVIDRENDVALKHLTGSDEVDIIEPVVGNDFRALFHENSVQQDENYTSDSQVKLSNENSESMKNFEILRNKSSSEPTEISPESFQNVLLRDKHQIILDQKKDVSLKSLKILEEPPNESDGYFLKDGILMHRWNFRNSENLIPYVDRVVVPQFLRQEILRIAHSIPIAGHMGIDKTRARIENHFYWPGFFSDIRTFCMSCPECQLVARKRVKERAPLSPVPIVSEPFEKIAIDIVGELPKTKSGFKYILTIVDYATRYPEAFPLKTIFSREIADALIRFFCSVGIPKELVSDQGANFIGKLMTQLYEQLGITKIKSSVYHPQANGLVERFNGTLKSMLRKLSNDIRNWDKYVPYLLFAYREVPQSSTGFSPFELLYGRVIRGPLAIVKESWIEKKTQDQNLTKYVLNMRQRMKMSKEIAQRNLQGSQEKQKEFFNRKSSHRQFQVGDKVIVLLPTPGNKLEVKWQGPFEITEISGDGRNFKVDTKKKIKRYRVYNIGLLRKWKEREVNGELGLIALEAGSQSSFEDFSYEFNNLRWQDVEICSDLGVNQRNALEELLQEFSDLFSEHPNRTNACEHVIHCGDAEPFRSAPYRVPKRYEKAYYEEIDYMLNLGIIRPSKSPWASPVVIVPKPDGKIRFCVDYRRLNKLTIMDAFPMPRAEELIERVARSSFISTLDLTKGYWQIPMHPESIEKTAFITPRGLYEFLTMPFGLKTAAATFQRMIKTKVLANLEEATDAYIDDVEIDTENFQDHISFLRRVFQRLRKFELSVKPSKCKLAFPKVDFIGYHIGSNAISPRAVLVKSIEDFPRPKSKKDLRSFLGLIGYYRRHIDKFSEKASPLTDQTRGKGTKIFWNEACEQSFLFFKTALSRFPILVPPNWKIDFLVQVDASNRGIGAVLAQRDTEGDDHPVCYISRKLNRSEEILSTTEKECLALVWAVSKLKYYLFARKFTVQVDHNPLVWLNRVKDKSQKLLRWSLTLQEYDFEVQYKPGKLHTNADALSRIF